MSDEKINYDKFCGTSDEVEFINEKSKKIEIDITSLQKGEKRVWVKATSKRKGHYRKVKGAKKVEESKKSAISRIESIIPNVHLEGATESQLESIASSVEETIGKFQDVKVHSISWSTEDDDFMYGMCDAAYIESRGDMLPRIILRKEVAVNASAWYSNRGKQFDISKNTNIKRCHKMIEGYLKWGGYEEELALWEEKLKNINGCSRLFVLQSESDKVKGIVCHECYHAIDEQMKLENIFSDQLEKIGVTKYDKMQVSDYAASKDTELWAEAGSAIDSGVDIPDSIRKAFEATMGTIR